MTKDYDDLKGKVVRATLSRTTLHGCRYGLVRRVVVTGRKTKNLSGLTFQMLDPEHAERDCALSTKFRGPRVTLKAGELATLAVKLRSGRFVRLDDWLAGNTTKPKETT